MSTRGVFGARGRQRFPTVPRGDIVATFDAYEQAQDAVDTLARADFPLAQVVIVGNDLASIERVTGRLSWGRAAAAGAASGAWMGLFFGVLLFFFSSSPQLGMLIAAILLGAGFGVLFGVVSYAFGRNRRDFTSVMQMAAVTYSLVVEPPVSSRARTLLEAAGVTTSAADAAESPSTDATLGVDDAPPRYGERLPQHPEPPAPPESRGPDEP